MATGTSVLDQRMGASSPGRIGVLIFGIALIIGFVYAASGKEPIIPPDLNGSEVRLRNRQSSWAGKPRRESFGPRPHAIFFKEGEFPWANAGIRKNPRHPAVFDHRFEIAEVILSEIRQRKDVYILPVVMQRGSPKCLVAPAVAAINHHPPAVWRGDDGALAVTDIEDFNFHRDLQANLF